MPGLYCERSPFECAYPTTQVFSEVDASVTFELRYSCGNACGIVLRAVDSVRFYSVEAVDMGRKGNDYHVSLVLHDEQGYLTEIACGYAPHAGQPDAVLHGGIEDRRMWERSSPGPATLRVTTDGPKIKVLMDGSEVFTAHDSTYRAGATGICVDGPVTILDYTLKATPAVGKAEPWRMIDKPRICFYPVPDDAVGGYHGASIVTRSTKGEIILSFYQGKRKPSGYPSIDGPTAGVAFTTSADDGRTWSPPKVAYRREGYLAHGLIYPHEDGRWTLVASESERIQGGQYAPPRIISMESADRGETWSEPHELILGGKPASDYGGEGRISLYGPIFRLSDGTLIQTWYWYSGANGTRRDSSVLVRSTDDGRTWSAPIFIDNTEFDTNECAVAELEPGHLVAFMRTLRARNMWRSESTDYGKTWAPMVQSTISAECPLLIAQQGALVLAGRGFGGLTVAMSFDGGQTWTRPRVIPVGSMGGMVGLSDGRVLATVSTWWGNPARMRACIFRITPDGPEAAFEGYEDVRYVSDLDLLWRE